MTTNRTELVAEIVAAVGATTATQLALVESSLTDIVLAIELRRNEEILIEDLSDANLLLVKNECIRRYRSG